MTLLEKLSGKIGILCLAGASLLLSVPGTLAQERAVPKNQAAMKQSFSRAAVSQWLALAVDWKGLVTCTQRPDNVPASRASNMATV